MQNRHKENGGGVRRSRGTKWVGVPGCGAPPPPGVGSDSPRVLASRLGSRLASRLGSRLVSRLAFTFFFPEHFRGS